MKLGLVLREAAKNAKKAQKNTKINRFGFVDLQIYVFRRRNYSFIYRGFDNRRIILAQIAISK